MKRKFGTWLLGKMAVYSDHAADFSSWPKWCAVARIKTFAALLECGCSWHSSWRNALKLYDMDGCRRSWPAEY